MCVCAQAIKERQLAALQCAEEKVAVADQAYVLVDKYIQMLGARPLPFPSSPPLSVMCALGCVLCC